MALVGVGSDGGLLALRRRLFGFGGFWAELGGSEKSAELPR